MDNRGVRSQLGRAWGQLVGARSKLGLARSQLGWSGCLKTSTKSTKFPLTSLSPIRKNSPNRSLAEKDVGGLSRRRVFHSHLRRRFQRLVFGFGVADDDDAQTTRIVDVEERGRRVEEERRRGGTRWRRGNVAFDAECCVGNVDSGRVGNGDNVGSSCAR